MVSISLDMVSGGTDFLLADTKYIVTFYEGEALSIQLPAKLTLTVIETSDAVKGDTVNNANKEAKVETGALVNVPCSSRMEIE
jgi:elongation factor P